MDKDVNQILEGDSSEKLKQIEDNSIDLIVTDPPYGYSFMGKDWDKAVVGVPTWKECLRVLKAGAFAFVMSAPRQDVLSRMICNLQDAGFRTDFTSIYWSYASGFPKAANVSKLADKRAGQNMSAFSRIIKDKRIELGLTKTQLAEYFKTSPDRINHGGCVSNWEDGKNSPTLEEYNKLVDILKLDKNQYPELEEAEREIIGEQKQKGNIGYENEDYHFEPKTRYITKSETDAAKKLDGSYAGFQPKPAVEVILIVMKPLCEKSFVDQALNNGKGVTWLDSCRLNGRFPANLLCSDDVLNGHSKYFDLDTWSRTQFIITPKAPPAERKGSTHPTMKPIKLMSYLVTMGSRENDIVLDPFCGSGTTLIAAHQLNRKWIGIELNAEYAAIARKRIEPYLLQTKLI